MTIIDIVQLNLYGDNERLLRTLMLLRMDQLSQIIV